MEPIFQGVELPSGRFQFKLADGVRVFIAVTIRGGNIDLTAVDVRASDVTSDLLRDVPIGKLRRVIADQLRASGASWLDGRALLAGLYRGSGKEVPEDLALAEKQAQEALDSLRRRAPRRGPNTMQDEHYRDISLAYIDAHRRDPRRPVAVLAEESGRSRNTVADWVRKARASGWLAKANPGRANAEPGPRLIKYLEGLEEE